MTPTNNPMEDKHLNFNQPILSVRRGSSTTAPAKAEGRKPTNAPPSTSIALIPYYKPELKSGPVSNPGVVPFQWERIPGRPKKDRKLRTKALDQPLPAPKLPPGRIVDADENSPYKLMKDSAGSNSQRVPECARILEDDREENGSSHSEGESSTYLDALDSTLSRSESCFLNCSLSGMSGSDCHGAKSSRTFSDPQTRDFMMGRFLPAAKKAIILDNKTPRYHYTLRKTLAQHCEDENDVEGVDEAEDEQDSDGDDDYAGTETVSTKLCGLLPRFCLLSTIPGMRDHAPLPLPSVHKANKRFSDSGVYKYKKSEKAIRDAVYERRRLTANQRSDMCVEATHDLKDELTPKRKDCTSWRELLADETAEKDLPIMSAAFEKTLYIDSGQTIEYRDSKSTSSESKSVIDSRGRISLLPPPLPKSPSESWLSRAIPSMSTKHPHSRTYLATKILDLKPSLAEPKWESVVKCSSLNINSFSLPTLTPISEN